MQRLPMAFCLLLLTACSDLLLIAPTENGTTDKPGTNVPSSPLPFAPATATPTMAVLAYPTYPASIPTAHVSVAPLYTLEALFDYAAHSLVVDESIVYQNATGQTLTSLVLAVEPNLWKGCFDLSSVTVDGQSETGLTLNNDRLEIPLVLPLVPDQTLKLSLHFDLNLPAADSHHVFGYNNLQVNLVDWYPFIVPFSGGWMIHPPANVGEHLVYDTATFDVTVTLTDPKLPITVAASTTAEAIAGSWHYLLHNARTFVFSASAGYKSALTTTNGIKITSYYFTDDKTQGQAVLDEVSKAVATFSNLFGPLSYPSLSIVESPFYDGMEYDGLFFLSRDFYKRDDGTVLNNLVDIAVHETAHQWWFGSVGSDQALEPWLDEAMATYSEWLFYENNYPQVTAWWAFRVEAYSPSGWVDMDIYHGDDFRSYANAVYLRGAQFLEALRGRVGDVAFFAFLKDYARQMAGRRATADDFFNILRQHTHVDFTNIQQAYFQRLH